MAELILIRHGETEWSRSGRHTGRTDVPLTAAGEAAGRALAPALAGRDVAAAFSSPLARALRTAELAGLAGVEPEPGLAEWDYGGYEGLTTAQIRETRPGWDIWRDGVVPDGADHPGEALADVAARADAVLARVRPLLARGNVVLVSHGHFLRVLAARWLGLEPSAGRHLGRPQPAMLCTLASEHELPVVATWNVPAGSSVAPAALRVDRLAAREHRDELREAP